MREPTQRLNEVNRYEGRIPIERAVLAEILLPGQSALASLPFFDDKIYDASVGINRTNVDIHDPFYNVAAMPGETIDVVWDIEQQRFHTARQFGLVQFVEALTNITVGNTGNGRVVHRGATSKVIIEIDNDSNYSSQDITAKDKIWVKYLPGDTTKISTGTSDAKKGRWVPLLVADTPGEPIYFTCTPDGPFTGNAFPKTYSGTQVVSGFGCILNNHPGATATLILDCVAGSFTIELKVFDVLGVLIGSDLASLTATDCIGIFQNNVELLAEFEIDGCRMSTLIYGTERDCRCNNASSIQSDFASLNAGNSSEQTFVNNNPPNPGTWQNTDPGVLPNGRIYWDGNFSFYNGGRSTRVTGPEVFQQTNLNVIRSSATVSAEPGVITNHLASPYGLRSTVVHEVTTSFSNFTAMGINVEDTDFASIGAPGEDYSFFIVYSITGAYVVYAGGAPAAHLAIETYWTETEVGGNPFASRTRCLLNGSIIDERDTQFSPCPGSRRLRLFGPAGPIQGAPPSSINVLIGSITNAQLSV